MSNALRAPRPSARLLDGQVYKLPMKWQSATICKYQSLQSMSNPDLALAESVSTTNLYFILVYVLILIYCCFGLAVVCDVYFVPALQKLSDTYHLPPDIAGSTLMALGASVPELFASLIGVFITEDDIGTGSIIGSSCFNLIAVPAACAFVAAATYSKKLTISPMPVMRNSAFYAITILVLLLIIKDNKVDILEASILLLFFFMYMAFMIFSAHSKHYSTDSSSQNSLTSSYISTDSAIAECNRQEQQVYGQFYFAQDESSYLKPGKSSYNAAQDERTPLASAFISKSYNRDTQITIPQQQQLYLGNAALAQTAAAVKGHNQVDSGSLRLPLDYLTARDTPCLAYSKSVTLGLSDSRRFGYIDLDGFGGEKQQQQQQKHMHEENWVSSKWILLPVLPLTFSMTLLTPYRFKNTCWTIWTFLVSIALIGGLTYISVWMVHLFGQTVGIPETISGMTILSWGTGIPELIASIVLIKKTAQADMAICNTIGSNVIDISFCLSLPWIVKCILSKTEGVKPEVSIQSSALPWTTCTLLLSVFLLIIILKMHNWELSYSVGVWLSLVYITFVVVATYLEYTYSAGGLDLMSVL